ncbi:arylsulfatase A-like enzyme [Prosthecobacter fusiformis]|uniref:Arylsulfatase A-like enzyme n=1 Tax=Prosthecobacter fusiformis TaxID=48464 RepID=A0A4R7SPC8_9BACT|nr:sulfatase-like hydrolase/transferase [Prosthecobacter fusiformis]TDU80764.1 arylsulfatase A-like enzyme [Prosthecobacter fusiformis]
MKKAFLLFSILSLWAGVTVAADRPNIVVFLVDDMGVMDTSVPFLTDAEGKPKKYPLNEHYRTPGMERLAAQGIRFNNFCAMSVCSPTRISIMTGQNAARHRATNWINPEKDNAGPQGPPDWNWAGLKRGDVTLPFVLHGAGYNTLHIGKAHFGPKALEGGEPLNLGFETNVGGGAMGAPGSYYAAKNFGWGSKRENNAVPHLEKYHGKDIFLTEALTLEAKDKLNALAKEKEPFFFYFAHYAVHAPFESDPRFEANYKDSGKEAPAQAFATLVEGMDKSLGDLLDHLDKLGVAEDTLIFFLGDNGSDAPLGNEHEVACAAPLRGKKGAHYEGGMRVPFIAAWAKRNEENRFQKMLPIPAGVIQRQQAAVQDLFPTVLALTGVAAPAGHVVDGLPLAKLLTGQADAERGERFLMHYPHSPHRTDYWTSLRDGEWKVIYHYFPTKVSKGSHYQLFNLKNDPFEQKDLAGEKPEELGRMMKTLVAELEAHQAVYPVDTDGKTRVKPKLP